MAVISQEFIDADNDSHRAGVWEAEKTNEVDEIWVVDAVHHQMGSLEIFLRVEVDAARHGCVRPLASWSVMRCCFSRVLRFVIGNAFLGYCDVGIVIQVYVPRCGADRRAY